MADRVGDRWHVDRLRVRNFRSCEDTSIEFDPHLTLLIGENGAGKTLILDALAVALSTPIRIFNGETGRGIHISDVRATPSDLPSIARVATVEPHYPVAVDVEAVLDGHRMTWQRSRTSAAGRTSWGDRHVRDFATGLIERATAQTAGRDFDVILPVIADYGVERLIGERRDQGRISSSRRDAYASALDPRSDLKRLFSFLERLDEQIVRAQAFEDDVPRLAKLQFSAVEQACDSVLAPVGWGRPRWDSTIEGVTLTHPEHGTLPLTSMATGTKITAGLAIDLASRMARANPGLGAEELLTRTPGIVLIDEVDLHLHPSWQQRIVPSLRRTFPNVQFILTTHSPQVLSTVPAKCVRILDESGVSTPEFSEGLRPNVILEKLQGTDPVPQVPVRQDLQKYVEMVSQGRGNAPEAVELRANLDRRLGGASLNPELLQADIALDIADWDD